MLVQIDFMQVNEFMDIGTLQHSLFSKSFYDVFQSYWMQQIFNK